MSRAVLLAFALVLLPHASPPAAGALVFRETTTHAADEADDDTAMALTLASMTPAERTKLVENVDYAASRLEAKVSPLVTDFGDDDRDPLDELRDATRHHQSSLAAARNLTRDHWTLDGLEVRFVDRCETAKLGPGERCAPLHGTEPAAKRARFAAWALSSARTIDFPNENAAEEAAETLRAHAAHSDSTIALVLTAHDETPEKARLIESATRLGRAMAANDITSEKQLESLAHPARKPFSIPAHAVLVVPRLLASTRPADFEREVDALLRH